MPTPYDLSSTGNTDWSWIPAIAQIIGGGMNLANANDGVTYGNEAARMADPWSPHRGAFQDQLINYMGQNSVDPSQVTAGTQNALGMLQNLLANPQSIRDNPAYRAGLDFGTEAVNRGAGASGMLNSGNRLTALDEFGQNYGMKFYNDIVGQLSNNVTSNINAADLGLRAQGQGYSQLEDLAGVRSGSPVAAANDYLWGRQQQAQSTGSGIGSLVNGIGGLAASVLPMIQRMLSGGSSGGLPTDLGGMNLNSPYWNQYSNPNYLDTQAGLESGISLDAFGPADSGSWFTDPTNFLTGIEGPW